MNDLENVYRLIQKRAADRSSDNSFSLGLSLDSEEIATLVKKHPELALCYGFWRDFSGETILHKSLSPFEGEEKECLALVHGIDEVITFIANRCDEVVEGGFYFLADGIDLSAYDHYIALSDEVAEKALSQGRRYIPYRLFLPEDVLVRPVDEEEKSGLFLVVVQNTYLDGIENVTRCHKAAEGEAKKVANLLFDEEMPEVVKALLAYNYLGLIANYSNLEKQGGDVALLPISVHSPYACLISHSCVCDAFSASLQILLAHGGVECRTISGLGHMWNLIKIDGDWFHADLTWDDEKDGCGHYFFLRSDDCFSLDHCWDDKYYPTCPKEVDFAEIIEDYLANNKQRLLEKGVDERVLQYRFRNLKVEKYLPFNRVNKG